MYGQRIFDLHEFATRDNSQAIQTSWVIQTAMNIQMCTVVMVMGIAPRVTAGRHVSISVRNRHYSISLHSTDCILQNGLLRM